MPALEGLCLFTGFTSSRLDAVLVTWMHGWVGGWADCWVHEWMDAWMDGWID